MGIECKNPKNVQSCNLPLGGDEAEQLVQAQACELEDDGISIKPDPANRNFCSYTAGSELIAPLSLQPVGFTRFEISSYAEFATYIAISKGVPQETPVEFRLAFSAGFDGGLPPESVVLEYTVVISDAIGWGGDESYVQSLVLQKVRDDYQLNAGEKNADVLIKISARANDSADQGQRKLTYYVGLSRNVLSPEERVRHVGPPFLTMQYCPEWVQHAEKIDGELNVDGTPILPGWVLLKKADGKYTAIPREAVKDANRDKLGSVDSYSYSLETQLTNSQFLKTTDPIRLLRSVTYQGLGGVVGLECPVFEVVILEISKTSKTCFEWSEKQEPAELKKKYKGKLTKFGNGYLIAQKGNSTFRYVGATEDKASLEAAKAEVAKRTKPKNGFEFSGIKSQQTLNDPVCAAYNLFPQYKEIEHDEEVDSMRDDDLEKAKRLVDTDTKKKNLDELGKVGKVKVVLKTDPETQKKQLIQIILDALHEDQPVPAQEVIFAVDRSGSMSDDAQAVAEHTEPIMTELRASSNENGLGLVAFTSSSTSSTGVDLLVPLQTELDDDEEVNRMRQGLSYIASNTDGGLEYSYEAAWRALDEFERTGSPESLKKILLLTDEGTIEKDLQIMPDGITPEKLHARADKLGVQFTVIFITEPSSANILYVPSKVKYLDYLEFLHVNPAEWKEEKQRVDFWLNILGDENADMQVKNYVVLLLGDVSPEFHAKVARAFGDRNNVLSEKYAIQTLAKFHVPEARDALLKITYAQLDPEFIDALAQYDDPESLNKFYNIYSDKTAARRVGAVLASLLLKDERVWNYMDDLIAIDGKYGLVNPGAIDRVIPFIEENGSPKAIEFLQKLSSQSAAARAALSRMGLETQSYDTLLVLAKNTVTDGKKWLPVIKKQYPEKFADALVEYLLDEVRTGILLDVQGIQQIIAEYSEYREKTIDQLIASYDSPVNDFAERQNRILAVLTLFESARAMDFVEQKLRIAEHPFSIVQTAVEIHRFNKNLKLLKTDAAAARDMLAADGEIQDHFAAAIALMRYHHDASALTVLLDLRLSSGHIYPYIAEALCEAFEELGTVEARALLVMIVNRMRRTLSVETKLKFLQTLGKIGSPAEISAISEYIHSPDDAIAQAAQEAIDAILAREELKDNE